MAIQLPAPAGTTYNNAPLKIVPYGWDKTGLTSFVLTRSNAQAVKNIAEGGVGLSLVGPPTEHTNYISLVSQSKYLQTQIAETNDMTICAVARSAGWLPGAGQSAILAANGPSHAIADGTRATQGLFLYAGGATQVTMVGDYYEGGNFRYSASVTVAINTWLCLIGRISSTLVKMQNKTTGTQSSIVPAHPTRDPSVDKLLFGSAIGSFLGGFDAPLFATWNRFITDAECDAFYAQLKTILSVDGIAI
jgi:hypothetical protein